jgi:hypothetical protein
MWEKAVVVWAVALPVVKRAKRTQFGSTRVRRRRLKAQNEPNFSIADCRLRIERCRAGTPNPRRGETCGTKPNLEILGHIGKGRHASRGPAGQQMRKTNPIPGIQARSRAGLAAREKVSKVRKASGPGRQAAEPRV